MRRLQEWMTKHHKMLVNNDMLKAMKVAVESGKIIDWPRIQTCLKHLKTLNEQHMGIFDKFIALCVRSIFIEVPRVAREWLM